MGILGLVSGKSRRGSKKVANRQTTKKMKSLKKIKKKAKSCEFC